MNDTIKLYKYGGEGCIFISDIPCNNGKKNRKNKKTKKRNKNRNKRKTKLLYTDLKSGEFKISNMIKKKSKNYYEWSILWDEMCLSKEYKSLKKIPEIKKCFVLNSINIHKDNAKFKLLKGDFVGGSVGNYYARIFNKDSTDKKIFIKEFIRLFRSMESLFIGLVELDKLNICHHDIKIDNTIIENNKLFYIDFGLSITIRETKKMIDRMKIEFNSERIYPSYPFEYIYYPKLNEEEIKYEKDGIIFKEHRKDYLYYKEVIHEKLFNRNMDHIRYNLLKYNSLKNIKSLFKKLDTYSLGILPLSILIESYDINNIKIDILISLLKMKEIKPYIDLLEQMTENNYRDRISPKDAYKKYLNLIKSPGLNASNNRSRYLSVHA